MPDRIRWFLVRRLGQLAPPSRRGALFISLLVPALIALSYGLHWGTLRAFSAALDPASVEGQCLGPRGRPIPFCDFSNHYFPQGREILSSGNLLRGFFYPPPFAIFVGVLALPGYRVALVLWVSVIVASMLVLYLVPQWDLFSRWKVAAFAYAALFAGSLPVLHDFNWGQVSSLTAALSLLAFLWCARGKGIAAAVPLSAAVSVKFYPAIFSAHLLCKCNLRSIVFCAATTGAMLLGIPGVVIGSQRTLDFYRGLLGRLGFLSGSIAASPYPNYMPNCVSMLLWREVKPESALFTGLEIAGFVVVGLNVLLLLLLIRARADHEGYWAAALMFTAIPFYVRTCWTHYFVFLPLVQTFSIVLVGVSKLPVWAKAALGLGFLVPSIVLSNVLFFFNYFSEPDAYYRGGYPFWSTALLLPLLYVHGILIILRARQPG